MTQAYIEIKDLTFARGQRQIFDGINLEIPQGAITAVMGPSGCGKTTLLRHIGGQLQADSGSVSVAGVQMNGLSRSELFALRKQMGMLFQSGALLTDLNVFENVAFPVREHYQFDESMVRDIVLMKLEIVGLRGAAQLMPSELSGGMARRVALARAIVLDPALMMYDEPFTGLDPITLGNIVTLIRSLSKSLGITSILVSHDINESLSIADYLCVLAEGKVVAQGPVEVVKATASPWLKQFLTGSTEGPVDFHYPATSRANDFHLEAKS
ncbi:ABC transporter ATP-binding protein [Leucothrix pacifica]|uniref:ABC transporter ATP-binding protein n=1 Tax=Leucothrix pacifica TaxID=1247513 RepID=UPI0026A62CAE